MPGEILETSRLLLKPLELADVEQAQTLFPHWEVVRLLADPVPWPFPPDAVRRFFEFVVLPAAARGDEWHWSIRLKSNPLQMIGAITLMKREGNNRGYWLGPPWWGQRLMIEACDAVTDYWFDTLGYPVLRESKAASNIASRRISQCQRMRLVAMTEDQYVSGRLPTEIWEITVEEWRGYQHSRRAA